MTGSARPIPTGAPVALWKQLDRRYYSLFEELHHAAIHCTNKQRGPKSGLVGQENFSKVGEFTKRVKIEFTKRVEDRGT